MNEAESFASNPAEASAAGDLPIGSSRHFVLACIGLLSWLADELPALWEQSVQRGSRIVERTQAAAQHQRAVVVEANPQAAAKGQNELDRLGLPSHRDFEMLLQQLIEVEQQIDQIATRRAAKP